MQIYVCVKHVPDTAASIRITGNDSFDDTSCKFVVNPYDEYGLEEAVQLVEKQGKGEVVVVTVGKEAAVASLRSAMALGAHRGILIKTDSQFLSSTLTAQALKAAILQDGTPDIIFTGKSSVDAEGFQTQYRLAAAMDLAVVNEIVDLKIINGKAIVEREIGSGSREVIEMQLPCVIGATKGLNEPRYPKFPDIMKAKKKPIKQIDFASLGLESPTDSAALLNLEATPERSGAKMLNGDVQEKIVELVRILKEEEKVL